MSATVSCCSCTVANALLPSSSGAVSTGDCRALCRAVDTAASRVSVNEPCRDADGDTNTPLSVCKLLKLVLGDSFDESLLFFFLMLNGELNDVLLLLLGESPCRESSLESLALLAGEPLGEENIPVALGLSVASFLRAP